MSRQMLDATSAKAFRAAKLRYFIIISVIVAIAIVCVVLVVHQQHQKSKFAKIAKEYAEINALYYKENLQDPNASSNSYASAQNVNHAKSMALFEQFALQHPKEPYGWQAAIRTANYYINQGNIQAAKELFEAIIPYTYKFPIIQIKVGTALAGIYTEQKEEAKALQQIEYISKIQDNPTAEKTGLLHSQILAVFGKFDQARQNLNTLNSEEAKIWLSYLEQ